MVRSAVVKRLMIRGGPAGEGVRNRERSQPSMAPSDPNRQPIPTDNLPMTVADNEYRTTTEPRLRGRALASTRMTSSDYRQR